jgi:hypothetical protein
MSSQTADYDGPRETTRSFTIQDVLWSFAVVAVIFGVPPVIAFYLLMVN